MKMYIYIYECTACIINVSNPYIQMIQVCRFLSLFQSIPRKYTHHSEGSIEKNTPTKKTPNPDARIQTHVPERTLGSMLSN